MGYAVKIGSKQRWESMKKDTRHQNYKSEIKVKIPGTTQAQESARPNSIKNK